MTTKQFALEAIKNGYEDGKENNYKNGYCCGWDWIRANLQELDHIFRLAGYEAQAGMKYKCMPFLTQDKTLTELEIDVLETAWFCNNERVHREKNEAYKTKMIEAGYLPLTEEIVRRAYKNENKLLIAAKRSMEWLTQKIEEVYKPFVDAKDVCWLMKPRASRKGYYLHQFENAFCKII